MENRNRLVLISTFVMALTIFVRGLGLPEQKSEGIQHNSDAADKIKNAIVLIGLNDASKTFTGVIPLLEKDIIHLLDANSTLADKVVGDSRKFNFIGQHSDDAEKGAASTMDMETSRLLPIVTTPSKALLLFSLHDTLVKTYRNQSNCVVFSREELEKICGSNNSTGNSTASG